MLVPVHLIDVPWPLAVEKVSEVLELDGYRRAIEAPKSVLDAYAFILSDIGGDCG
jgi:hypothetical protein